MLTIDPKIQESVDVLLAHLGEERCFSRFIEKLIRNYMNENKELLKEAYETRSSHLSTLS